MLIVFLHHKVNYFGCLRTQRVELKRLLTTSCPEFFHVSNKMKDARNKHIDGNKVKDSKSKEEILTAVEAVSTSINEVATSLTKIFDFKQSETSTNVIIGFGDITWGAMRSRKRWFLLATKADADTNRHRSLLPMDPECVEKLPKMQWDQ